MRYAFAIVALTLCVGCDYTTGPKPKYEACGHMEYSDSLAVGDSVPGIHLRCPVLK